ncbi:unnamed protein product, partial [Nesidiocoris tenuis]
MSTLPPESKDCLFEYLWGHQTCARPPRRRKQAPAPPFSPSTFWQRQNHGKIVFNLIPKASKSDQEFRRHKNLFREIYASQMGRYQAECLR